MLESSPQRATNVGYRRRQWFWAVTCLAVVLATACGSRGGKQETTATTELTTATQSATVSSAPAAPAPSAAQITIDGFSYGQPVTVAPGAQITVVNKDSAAHTVTSNTPGKFDVDVAGNAQSTFTAPTEPGSYPYHCTYHASMHGTLVVQ